MALQQGKFDARVHIGQRFTRHLRKDRADAAKYKACETLGSIAEKCALAFDRKAAIAAATRYCKARARMGGQWSRWDVMAEVMLFFYIKTEHSELFTEAWTKFEKTTVDTRKEEVELDGDSLPQSPASSLGRLCLPRHIVLLLHCRHRPQQTTNAASRSSGSVA